jgi:L-Ala-D/L-Glu epimerase
MLKLTVTRESWPIAGHFTIARGSKTAAEVIVVMLQHGPHTGRGECVPYPRYGETVDAAVAELEEARLAIEAGLSRQDITRLLSLYSARNALDCAMWDLEAKRSGTPVWKSAGLPPPQPCVTAFTLSLASPEAMAEAARRNAHMPLLKLKLGGDGDIERLRLIREAAPRNRLIIDANEGWRPEQLPQLLAACASAGVELVEQPLPADDDDALLHIKSEVAICADESAHGSESLAKLQGKYSAINIKLDKTGGLTPALELKAAALQQKFKIMVGSMVATSLAMAPAMLLAQDASVVDLDGPLLLARDRSLGISYQKGVMQPPPPGLWGE